MATPTQDDVNEFVASARSYSPTKMLEVLRRWGPAIVNLADLHGNTALKVAVMNENYELFAPLLKAGASMTLENSKQNSALVGAAIWGSPKVLRWMIDAGADVNFRDRHGIPLFVYLVSRRASPDDVLRLQMVLERPELDLDVRHEGKSIEEHALDRGFARLALMIKEERARRRDAAALPVMKTPCHVSRNEVAQFLKYFPQGHTDEGSPLHTLARLPYSSSCVEAARTLLQEGADPNVVDSFGDTPVLIAVLSRNLPMVELLLQFEADVDIPNKRGITPLHYAFRTTDLRNMIFKASARSEAEFIRRNELAHELLKALNKDFWADSVYAEKYADERIAISSDVDRFERSLIDIGYLPLAGKSRTSRE
jgi:ankyrin repeat protein